MIRTIVLLISLLATLLSGCQSRQEPPPFEILSRQLHTKTDDQGSKLFAYVVSVKATGYQGFKSGEKVSRSEARRLMNYQHFEDSRVLKLQLEDQAVESLKKELKQQAYCAKGHRIDEVLWRDLSVQLRGHCL